MKEERYYFLFDSCEHGILLRMLNDKKTDLIRSGKSTDAVDELIVKVGTVPTKKFKVIEKSNAYAR